MVVGQKISVNGSGQKTSVNGSGQKTSVNGSGRKIIRLEERQHILKFCLSTLQPVKIISQQNKSRRQYESGTSPKETT